MRRKQLYTLDHRLLLVIEEPILTRLKTGYYWMPRRRRMLRCMLTRRTVTASDVPTLRTPTEMKPPASRGRQAFYTSVATWFGSGVDSARSLFHLRYSLRGLCSQWNVKATARPPDTALFRDCLSFGRLAEWLLAAYRDHQFGISDGLDQQMRRTNLIIPNVFVSIAISSTESLNWNGQGIKKTVSFKTDDSGSSIRGFSLVGAVAATAQSHVPKPACVQPGL